MTLRSHPNHRERGPVKYITVYDVAAARGVSVGAVRAHINRGHLDMTDVISIARYVLRIRDQETPRIKE